MSRRRRRHPVDNIARDVSQQRLGGPGRFPDFLGAGLSWRAYAINEAVGGEHRRLVLRIPWPAQPGQPETARREHRLLAYLNTLDLPLRVPLPIGEIEVSSGLALLQSFVGGWPLEMRPSGAVSAPWQVIAEIASTCHQLPAQPLRALLPGEATCTAHARQQLCSFEELPEWKQAHALLMTYLPPEEPTVLLHGDLLGQNIRVDLLGDAGLGVLDWSEAQLGDPAYDLAIVARGARRPFQAAGGRQKLVDAYNRRVDVPISINRVRFYEACMLATWIQDAQQNMPGDVEHLSNQLRRLLRSMQRSQGG